MKKDSPKALDLPCLEALISAAGDRGLQYAPKVQRGIQLREMGMSLRIRLMLMSSTLLLAAAGAHGQDFYSNAAGVRATISSAALMSLSSTDYL